MKFLHLMFSVICILFITACSSDIESDFDLENSGIEPIATKAATSTKLRIGSINASSVERVNENGDFYNLKDGNRKTIWHSKWSEQGSGTVNLTFWFFSTPNKLDYIMYYPRENGGLNGNWGKVNVYVATKEYPTPNYTKVVTYDHKYSSQPAKIVLPYTIDTPTSVKFEILSGYNGYASGAEIEFYGNGEESKPEVELAPATAKVPLYPNTFITAGTGTTVTSTGIARWASTNTVYTSYFRANKTGNLSLYLNCVPNGEGNVVKVTAGGKVFNVTLPKGNGSEVSVPIGMVPVTKVGYVKVDMQATTIKNGNLGSVKSFGVGGLTDLTYGQVSVDRGANSVNLWYIEPTTANIEWFYNEITVPAGYDPIHTYYATNGSAQSYAGIQVNSATERRILFSVWSPYDTQNPNQIPADYKVKFISSGPGVKRNQFGNEGSGSQSLLVYNWKTASTYKILTGIKPLSNGSTQYVCYYFAPEIGAWRLMAKMERPKTQTWYKGAYSFLEDFAGSGEKTRMGYYGNQWMRTAAGQWVEVVSATVNTGNATARRDVCAGVNQSGFYLKSGGYFDEYTTSYTKLTRPRKSVAPVINFNTLPQ